MPDYSEEIADLEQLIDAAAKRVSVDGVTVDYDLEQAQKRLRALKAKDATNRGRRPVTSRIDLGGF